MLSAFLRAVTGVLVFLGVFFYPFHFTVSSQSPEYYSWQEPPSSITGLQSFETKRPPVGEKDNPLQTPLQPKEIPPLPQQPVAVKPPLVEHTQIVKRVEVKGKVGISFDDGPIPGMTEQYLEVLEHYDTRATFFMVGQRVNRHPGLARKVIEQGSEIGSHSWRHDRLDQLEPEKVIEDLRSVTEQVYDILGKEVNLLRPPYGRHSEAVVTAAQEFNQQIILWDVDPRDWEDPPPEEIVARIMAQVKPGSIIILHEGHKNTLQALPEVIQKIRECDLEPVPVSELFN